MSRYVVRRLLLLLPVLLGISLVLFTILALVFSSREAIRKRLGAPAALGIPYVRGQRGI